MSRAWFDLQVNGYAGVDFSSDDLTGERLHTACARLNADGCDGVLATLITAEAETLGRRLAKLAELRELDPLAREMIHGFHLEGPFISPVAGFVGAHPARWVLAADWDWIERWMDAAGGLLRLVTLAPEQDRGAEVTRRLVKAGVCVAAGHTDASLDELRRSIDAGLSLFTHLGNGCPVLLARHDNIVQRVLHLAERLWITLIADGAHVPFFALANYLRLIGVERAIVVTDATAAAGMGPGRYMIGEVEAVVGDDGVPRHATNPSQFAGSALTMPQAAKNLTDALGYSARDVERMLSLNPRRALGI